MPDRLNPIGVFDSGVGGISVLAELARLMPHEDFWYYGDTVHAPYGTKPVELVREYSGAIVSRMLEIPVKAIVIACNTASSAAAQMLRERYDLPIIAMEPALKPASELRHGGKILVLATSNTLALPKYRHLYALYGEGAESVPCPGLMEYVERGDENGARSYLQELFGRYTAPLDAVVLGCTHYVFLRHVVQSLLPAQTAVLDGNLGTSRQCMRVLSDRGLLREEGGGHISFHTSLEDGTKTQKIQSASEVRRMEALFARARELLKTEGNPAEN